MIIFEKFYRQNRIKIHTKTLQIAQFKKIYRRTMPPNPPSKAHEISKSEKNIIAPLLRNPGYAPDYRADGHTFEHATRHKLLFLLLIN